MSRRTRPTPAHDPAKEARDAAFLDAVLAEIRHELVTRPYGNKPPKLRLVPPEQPDGDAAPVVTP